MRATLILLAAALAAGTVGARARELAPQTLTEAESAFLTVPGAERARVSNAAVATVTLREGGETELAGLRMGAATVTFFGVGGPVATLEVNVHPAYWGMLGRLFADDPEIRA